MVRISVELPDEVAEALGRLAKARATSLEALLVGVIAARVDAYIGQSAAEDQAVAAPVLSDAASGTGPLS